MSVASAVLLVALIGGTPALKVVSAPEDAAQVQVVAELSVDQMAAIPEGVVTRQVGRGLLTFGIVEGDGTSVFPMLGDYRRTGSQLIFTPRFRLSAGLSYAAKFTGDDAATSIVMYRFTAEPRNDKAVVTDVFPAASKLPANSLKFYIHFSRSMREGRAIFERIHLLDDQGKKVHDPWRRTELWTEDARRFTLWIHPGRVKQGVNLREDLGPVLDPGRKYTLLIEQSVQSQDGQPLQKDYRKVFRTVADDRSQPLPQKWKLKLPSSETRQPLRLDFGEPLDHALVQRCIEIHTAEGQPVKFHMVLQNDDSVALLTPAEAWQSEEYRVIVDPILEDLAGNTPTRIFDTDLTEQPGPQPQLRLPFRPTVTASVR